MTMANSAANGDATTPQQNNNEVSRNNEVEKGSSYGPPNAGSGETVPEKEVCQDGRPVKNAGSNQESDS